MKKIFSIVFLFSATALAGLHSVAFWLEVHDEKGKEIQDAKVNVSFMYSKGPGEGAGAKVYQRINKTTNSNGVCNVEGKSDNMISCSVAKEGYYPFVIRNFKLDSVRFGKWQPWNKKYNVLLRRIENPIPMYARNISGDNEKQWLPRTGAFFGFDLMKSDWVMPHGKGTVSDFLIKLDVVDAKVPEDFYLNRPRSSKKVNRTLTIKFSNPDDGIQVVREEPAGGSDFKLPRLAPEEGYKNEYISQFWSQPDDRRDDIAEDKNYFFRVRTTRDEEGNVVDGLYGKIRGPIRFETKGRVKFTYYLNPTPNDRNLEFDPGQNLFKNLSSLEQVHEP